MTGGGGGRISNKVVECYTAICNVTETWRDSRSDNQNF